MVYIDVRPLRGRAVILNLTLMRPIPLTPLRMATLTLGFVAMAWANIGSAQTDAEMGNQYYRFSNAELEAVCGRMSPKSHVSGLTDGAFLAIPWTGRTYFYQSACYLELARRTVDLAWCPKVRERKTLLGNGSSHSPASCQRLVASVLQNQTRNQHSADRHAAAVQGVFKITSAQATELPGGDWLLTVQTAGTLAGRYRFAIENSRDRGRLVTQELSLPLAGPHRWTLSRQQVLGRTALPAIFPIAVSLTFVFPEGSSNANEEHLTSIQNLALSAQ